MQKRFTVVLEFNCYLPEAGSSVWLSPGDEQLINEFDNLTDIPGAVRLVGPVPSKEGEAAYERLCSFFREMNINFTSLVIADD